MVMGGACGRIGYDPIDAGGAGGRGGSLGTGGTGGTGAGVGGSAAGAGGSAAGAGGSAAGAGGSAAGTGGTTGGAGGAGGGSAISCFTDSFGGHQYQFCDAMVDWASARAECEGRGMRLVRLDDAAENTWIQATAVFSASMFRRESLWLGGYEPTTDGDWHWTDGAAFWLGGVNGVAVGGLYTNWDTREPNNAVGPEACLAMPLNGTVWWDYQCTSPAYFACEMY
jgi:hypothetical protein